MVGVPREILDLILLNLAHYECPTTERIATLTPALKQSILNARLAWLSLCHQYPLCEIFLDIPAEIPFIIPQGLTHYALLALFNKLSKFSLFPRSKISLRSNTSATTHSQAIISNAHRDTKTVPLTMAS
jgi:hypothetical protein